MGRLGYLLLAFLWLAAGCQSAFVDASIKNGTSAPISLIEVDYPSASFGLQSLAPGAEKQYRFKILGTGPLKITYTDATGKEQTSKGPVLQEGSAGSLSILVATGGVQWTPKLH